MISVKVPVKEISDFNKMFHDLTLAIPKIKNVRQIEGCETHKLILLSSKTKELDDYINDKKVDVNDKETLTLTYENLTLSKNHTI